MPFVERLVNGINYLRGRSEGGADARGVGAELRTTTGDRVIPRPGQEGLLLKRSVAVGAIALALAPFSVCAAPLGEEVKHLLDTHPQIAAAKQGVRAADEGINESGAAFYPQIFFDGEYGWEDVDSPATRARGLLGGDPNKTGPRDRQTLEFNLNVFDGFRKYADLQRSRLEKSAAEFNLEATRQQIAFQAVTAYLDVLRQRQLVELALLSESNIQRQLNLEDERVRRGSGLTVDVLQSKSRLQIAKEFRVGREGALRNAQSRYVQVFGRAPGVAEMADPAPPIDTLPTTLEDAVKAARGDNPQLSTSARQIDIADQVKRSAKADYFPKVDFVVEGNRENDFEGIRGLRREVAVIVRGRWELFSGFARQARVARASAERSARVSDYANLDRQVSDAVRIAWNSLETSRVRRDLLENAVVIAQEVFDARGRLRDAGKETVINVLLSENEVNNARIQLTNASYDVMLAIYQLHFAIGTLNEATISVQ